MWKVKAGIIGILALGVASVSGGVSRAIQILNESGGKVQLFWIHPQTSERSLMSDPAIFNGASFPLNSFVGHAFEVREVPSPSTGKCSRAPDQKCRSAFFEVSAGDEQGT